jgi:hypothetical protein
MLPTGKWLPYTRDIHNKGLLSITGNSSCGDDGTHFVTIDKEFDNGIAMIKEQKGRQGAVLGGSQSPDVYVHEWGHTFASLNDEYLYANESVAFALPLSNCSLNPRNDYLYNARLFGGINNRGCSFLYLPTGLHSGGRQYFYRPTFASIMGGPVDTSERPKLFNAVSCGYILAAIKGGDAHSYFPECAKMEGIIKDGVTAQNVFAPVFALFKGEARDFFGAAGAADIPSGSGVKVLISGNEPPAEFQALSAEETEQVKSSEGSPDKCLDATAKGLFDIKQQPFRKDLETGWKNKAQCAQKIAEATTLQQKIDGLKASLAATDERISSLAASKQEMSAITTLKGDTVYTIPAGEEQEKVYPQVTGVALKCVSHLEVPLGTNNTTKGAVFASEDQKKVAELLAIERRKNQVANMTYVNALAKGGGAVTDAVRQIPTAQITKLTEALGATFMPVSKGVLSKNYGDVESAKNFISVSMSLTLGADGRKKPCDTPYFMGGAVGAWFEGTVTIDSVSYPHACIPEANIIKKKRK